jgi:small subunit ribosomal protein S21
MRNHLLFFFYLHKTQFERSFPAENFHHDFQFLFLIVPVKEGENIERALKKFKRKFEKTGTVKELRNRQAFRKPSVVKRQQKMKAVYVQQLQQNEE